MLNLKYPVTLEYIPYDVSKLPHKVHFCSKGSCQDIFEEQLVLLRDKLTSNGCT